MTQRLLVVLLLLMFVGTYAQAGKAEPNGKSSIMHVDQLLASLRQNGRGDQSAATRVVSLMEDLHPSLYVKSGDVKNYGQTAPVLLFTDSASLQSVRNLSASQIGQIQMATIRVSSNEMRTLDLSVFSGFPNLEYIFIQAPEGSTAQSVQNMVQNPNPNQQVFYDLSRIN